MLALIAGTVLALVALGFVLYPLFQDEVPVAARVAAVAAGRARDAAAEADGREQSVAALRELEFDRATGKLSERDYATLKDVYTREALVALRAAPAGATGGPATGQAPDDVEAMILSYRARQLHCATCGPRPESDARYCSSCGGYLAGACASCGAAVAETSPTFCHDCGHRLAA